LLDITRKYLAISKKKCIGDKNADEDVASIERIEKLRNIAEKFPVWPFDTRTLRKFFFALSTPAISALVTGLVSLLLSLIGE